MKGRIFCIFLFLFVAALPLSAGVDPSLYTYGFQVYSWLTDGTYDVDWNVGLSTQEFGQAWAGRVKWNDPPADSNLCDITFLISTPNNELFLYNENDSTIKIPFTLHLTSTGPPEQVFPVTKLPHRFDFSLDDFWNLYLQFNVTIPPPVYTLPLAGHEGIYATYFNVSIYVDYGGADEYLLGKETWIFSVKAGGWQYPTYTYYQLFLDRYPTADDIPVTTMQLNQAQSLVVGSVTLISNDSNAYKKDKKNGVPFEFRISPLTPAAVTDPYASMFAFRITDSATSPIPFKVRVPSRSSLSATAFRFDVAGRGSSGYWQDWFEIAISAMNYADEPLSAGAYSATIRIELISKN